MLCILGIFGTHTIYTGIFISKYGKGGKIYKYLTILIFKYFHHCWEGRERSPLQIGLERVLAGATAWYLTTEHGDSSQRLSSLHVQAGAESAEKY